MYEDEKQYILTVWFFHLSQNIVVIKFILHLQLHFIEQSAKILFKNTLFYSKTILLIL